MFSTIYFLSQTLFWASLKDDEFRYCLLGKRREIIFIRGKPALWLHTICPCGGGGTKQWNRVTNYDHLTDEIIRLGRRFGNWINHWFIKKSGEVGTCIQDKISSVWTKYIYNTRLFLDSIHTVVSLGVTPDKLFDKNTERCAGPPFISGRMSVNARCVITNYFMTETIIKFLFIIQNRTITM